MADNNKPFVIKELATALGAQETWRIDWLGDVVRPRPSVAQHGIDLFLSPLRPGLKGVVTHPEAADRLRQQLVRVGVGYLPALHIGATFKSGAPVAMPPERYRRVRLAIDPGTAQFFPFETLISRNFPWDPPRYAVQPSEFGVGPRAWRQAKDSLLLAMADPQGDDPYFITIPCTEVVRFFFCPSSLLARHLFSNGWSELIWPPGCATDDLPNSVTVGLRTVAGLKHAHARHLAFTLASNATNQCVRGIHQAFQTTNSGIATSLLKCSFPFRDPVRIEADVVEIPAGTKSGKRYFVTRLHTCERPIPFRICYANPMMNSNQGQNKDDEDLQSMILGGDKQHGPDNGTRAPFVGNLEELENRRELTDDEGPPAEYAQELLIELDEDRFPGLRDIPVPQAPKDYQKYRNAGSNATALPITAKSSSTANPQGSSRSVLPAQIESMPRDPKSVDVLSPTAMLLAAGPLLEDTNNIVKVLPPIELMRFDKNPRHRRSWAKIEVGNSDLNKRTVFRSRRLFALTLKYPTAKFLIVDIEPRGEQEGFALTGFVVPLSLSFDEFLQRLCTTIVDQKGWPQFDVHQRQFLFDGRNRCIGERTPHNPSDDHKALAARLDNYIVQPLLRHR